MKCSVNGNNSATWLYTSWNASKETTIYLGKDIYAPWRSRYKIDKNISGQHNLIIDSVHLAHAGRYNCYSAVTRRSDVQLSVLGSSPSCSSNISSSLLDGIAKRHQRLSISCSINYTGNATPDYTWTKIRVQQSVGTKAITSEVRQTLSAKASSIIEQLHVSDNGATLQCQITFQGTDYKYTWNYSLYGPMNLSIVRYEDRLECSADGNPTPNYGWLHVETNTSTDGSIFILNGTIKPDKDHSFQCTATNLFASERKIFKIYNLSKSDDTSKNLDSESEDQITTQKNTAEVALILASLCLAGLVLLGFGLGLTKLSTFINAGRAATFRTTPSTQEGHEMTVTYADYCAIDQPTASQEPQLYCEIRLNDQQNADYINQPSA